MTMSIMNGYGLLETHCWIVAILTQVDSDLYEIYSHYLEGAAS